MIRKTPGNTLANELNFEVGIKEVAGRAETGKPFQIDLFTDVSGFGERHLAAVALALGAEDVAGWSAAERRLTRRLPAVPDSMVAGVRNLIRSGQDPLGDIFCHLRGPSERRSQGAVFTPQRIVSAMVAWAASRIEPTRVVDPGLGSGRFLIEAGLRFDGAFLVGIEIDPLVALIARANIAAMGLGPRSSVLLEDYRAVELPHRSGPSLFVGNPPYVRHHLLDSQWKEWLTAQARERFKIRASQLAGLHVHFFLATALKASPGDLGAFITSAEWLDVNYGNLVRELLLDGLGGESITVLEPDVFPFGDTATTAAITCFELGREPESIRIRRVRKLAALGELRGGRPIRRERLHSESRWSLITHTIPKPPEGFVELGELCRVHRGQVTGANKFWIAGQHSADLPESVLIPTVTRARELIRAGRVLENDFNLRKVIDLPEDLGQFDEAERRTIQRFLKKARSLGVHEGYIASSRRTWWSVGLKDRAPILSTYMARRPPAFVYNQAGARHLNIAHGLYPRERLSQEILLKLVNYLCESTEIRHGRTYAGGLTKFEPRELERVFVPSLEILSKTRA